MKKKIILLVLFILCISILHGQVSFQYEFSLDKLDPDDEFQDIKLFDYDDDGDEEIFIGYNNGNVMKIVCYDMFGDTVFTYIESLASNTEFQKFAFVEDDNEDKLIVGSRIKGGDINRKLLVKIYNLSSTSLIDSLIYQVPWPTGDWVNPLDIKTILYTWFDSNVLIYIGYIHNWGFEDYDEQEEFEKSYITKFLYADSLSHVENIEHCGNYCSQINDSLIITVGSYYYEWGALSTMPYASGNKKYYMRRLTNELTSNIFPIAYISGSWDFDPHYGSTYNHYPSQFFILSRNNFNSEFYGNVLYYKIKDSSAGNNLTYKNYSYDFSDTLWEKTNTQTGYDNICSQSCVEFNNQDKYLIYFREDSLEIRDRENGDIFHYQDSTIDPFRICRLDNGDLLIFSEKQDETGYDIYSINNPFYAIDDNEEYQNQFTLQNFPNPFRNSTTIFFSETTRLRCATPWQANSHGLARIGIYNVKGQLVRDFSIVTPSPSRSVSVTWDGTDKYGKEVTPGIYFYKFKTDEKEIIGKMIKIK